MKTILVPTLSIKPEWHVLADSRTVKRLKTFLMISIGLVYALTLSGCSFNTSDRLSSHLRIKNSSSIQITNIRTSSLIMKMTWGDLVEYSNTFPNLPANAIGEYQDILSGYNRNENVSNSSFIKELRVMYDSAGSTTTKLVFDDGLEYTTSTWGYLTNEKKAQVRMFPDSFYTLEITDATVSISKD